MSDCLRNLLRRFFPNKTVHGKTYSPIDDARFKSGIPTWVKLGSNIPGVVVPGAITLGLYDIHYDPEHVSMTNGNRYSMRTLIEEVAHTEQFLDVWAALEDKEPFKDGWRPAPLSYERAQYKWKMVYLWRSIKDGGYDNEIEREAQGKAERILEELRTKDLKGDRAGKLCGFDLWR